MSLSDKMMNGLNKINCLVLSVEDIKTAVKKLKKWAWGLPTYEGKVANEVIDEIFGEKLI